MRESTYRLYGALHHNNNNNNNNNGSNNNISVRVAVTTTDDRRRAKASAVARVSLPGVWPAVAANIAGNAAGKSPRGWEGTGSPRPDASPEKRSRAAGAVLARSRNGPADGGRDIRVAFARKLPRERPGHRFPPPRKVIRDDIRSHYVRGVCTVRTHANAESCRGASVASPGLILRISFNCA